MRLEDAVQVGGHCGHCTGGPAWHHELCPADQTVPDQTVLVVEDDPAIADLLDLYLRQAGFRVLQAPTGERGLELVAQQRPVLVVLDIGLPGIDGLEVCRRIRADSSLPILFLTARDGEIDRVLGLELGADDYVVKPFSPREVVARVKAILRRGAPNAADRSPSVIEVGDGIEVDLARREVRVAATPGGAGQPGVRPPGLPGRQPGTGAVPPAAAGRCVGCGLVRGRAHGRCPRPPAPHASWATTCP